MIYIYRFSREEQIIQKSLITYSKYEIVFQDILVYCAVAIVKYCDKINLREKEFNLAHNLSYSLRWQGSHSSFSWRELVNHITSTVKNS